MQILDKKNIAIEGGKLQRGVGEDTAIAKAQMPEADQGMWFKLAS